MRVSSFPAYPQLDGLVDLGSRNNIDIQPTLLRVLTDLYVQKPNHSAEEEAQYVELALRLIPIVDAPTRAAVAARLRTYPKAPFAILQQMPVEEPDLALNFDGGEDEHVAPTAPAAPDPGIASELCELFFTASAIERRLILLNLDTANAQTSTTPASADTIRRMENAALAQDAGGVARELERCLELGPAIARRIADDRSGEPIVVAARLIAMPPAVLQRVLLFLNPGVGQSVQRVYELALLYDEIQPAAAEQMIGIWRQADGKPERTLKNRPHQSHYAESAPGHPRRASTHPSKAAAGVTPAQRKASAARQT